MSEQIENHVLKKYSLVKKVGSGAYGHVWKVTDKKTNQTLALKKIFDAFQHSTDAQRTYREIVFLHELDHSNIIKMHNVIRAENDKDLYLVFEYMEADLHNAIGQKILQDIHNRFIIYQVIKGIKFMHSAELIHRDLKPSNVLLNSDCHLKICDFGLARSLVADHQDSNIHLTEQVATRWYRAPQVLLGSQTYDKSADIWSIGCILGELLIGKPMFPGNSTLNQLERIISFTGNPSKQDILSLNSETALTMINSINQFKTKSIKQWFKPETPKQAIDLIARMLSFNPSKRPTANQILKHPYLDKFHKTSDQKDCHKIIYPPVSDNKKLNLKQYRNLIYQRIKQYYRGHEEEERSITPGRISNSNGTSFSQHSQTRHQSNDVTKNRPSQNSQHSHNQHRYSQNKSRNTPNGVHNNTNYSGITSPHQYHHATHTNEVTRKNSLKDILRNKSSNKTSAHSSFNHEPLTRYNSSIIHHTNSPMNNCVNQANHSQNVHAQKYYRKNTLGAAIYKQNKLGRHI